MELTPEEAWSRILESARAKLPQQSFHTWLAQTKTNALANDVLVLEVPSDFALEWIESKYGDVLRAATKRVLGEEYRLAFEVRQPPGRRTLPAPTPELRPLNEPRPDEQKPAADPKCVIGTLVARYTLERFVVANNNQFAFAAAQAVATGPERVYNPLFIHGGVGLGKTHLMQAIGNTVLQRNPRTRVGYLPTEKFTNELIAAIQTRTTTEFHARYRRLDLLLVDDVQFLAGREGTQEEFFHTFNALHDAQKQLVLTSDRPPHEIPDLQERLISRFQWGLVVDIKPPDFETRMAILQMKAAQDGLEVPEPVLGLIAEHCRSSVRELEGALIKLLAMSSITQRDLTIDLARDVLSTTLPAQQPVTPENIEKAVCDAFGVKLADLQSKSRQRHVTEPRQVAMYLEKTLLDLPYTQIGYRFGGRDHSTVIHSIQKVQELLDAEPSFKARLDSIRAKLAH